MCEDNLPDEVYGKLVELIGKEKAQKFIKDTDYNFYAIQKRILILTVFKNLKRYFPVGNIYSIFLSKYRPYLLVLLVLLIFAIILNLI